MAKIYWDVGKYHPETKNQKVYWNVGGNANEIGGAAYLGGKVAAGAASIGIGAYNLVAGAWDQLTGNTYRAEKRYAENSATAFSEKLDGMYNANGGMKFAGAVAEGVGQFLPTFALSFIPYVGGALSVGTQFAAYTGMNVEEAYKKTGELGAKEYAYGAALGGFETALEFVGGKVGGWIGGTKVFDVSKGITKGASKAAASAGKLGVSTVGANMLKGGASEFAEEFIESYAEVGLQKALKIDPNASITFQDALYAGAVGFAAGGVISGAGSTLNTVGSTQIGKRVMDAGEAEMTVAAATEIADSFSPNGKYQAEAVSKLRDNLDLWERTADKTGTQAQMILGNIRTAMSVCEVYAAQSGTYAAVKANPEKFLGYARALFGEDVTVEDLKNPDSTVTRYIAAAEWAGGEVQKLTLRAEKARMAEEIARINEGRSTAVRLSDAEWRGGNAMYDLGNGAYVYVVGRGDSYTVMIGPDTDNVQAFTNTDGDTVLTEEEVSRLLGELRGAPMAPPTPRENGRAPAVEEYDGYFEREADGDAADGENDGESAEDGAQEGNGEQEPKQSLGEDAEQNPPAQNGAAEGAAGGGERKRDTALRRDRRERLLDEYDESVKARAHKLVKRADYLSAERRAALYETVASATGIDDRTLKAALAVEAGRAGLVLYFNREMNERYEGKPTKGAQKVFANGTRLIAVAAGIDGVKQAMVHEIFHDIRASGVGAQLEKFAIATGDAERMERTAKRYTDAFAKKYKTPTLAEFRKAGEYKTLLDLVYAYDAKYKEQLNGQSLAEEVAASEIGDKLGTKRFLRRLAISEAMANKPGLVRRIFARFKGMLARFDWKVGRDHVAAMERAYLLACKEAPVMQAIRELRGASARSGSVFFNWYREGADYAASVERVAQDVMAGRTAAEVEYGRQDRLAAMQSADRRQHRSHGTVTKMAIGEEDYADYNKPITAQDVNVLRSIGRKSINEFTSEEIKKAQKWAYKFYRELGVKSPFFRAWFGDWRANSTDGLLIPNVDVSAPIKAGNEINIDTGRKISWNPEARKESILNAPKQHKGEIGIIAANMSEIVRTAVLLDTVVSEKRSERKLPGTTFMHSFYSLAPIDGHITLVKLFAEEAISPKNGVSFTRAYSLKYIEKVAEIDNGVLLNDEGLTESHSTTTYSISDLFGFVKQYDAEFSPKPVHKVLLNEDGTPKVFYHGTSERFSAFSVDEIAAREGSFFFAENQEDAEAYGENIYEVYLTGSKLADYDNQPREFYQLKSKREQVEWLKERGFDGWYADMDSGGWGEVSVFSPEQIKSATDNIGTFDGGESDTRFSLGEEGRALTRGEVARRLADAKRWRVYDRREIDALVDGMLRDDTYAAEGLEIALHGKDRVQVVEYLWEQANGAKESDMEAVYDRIADFVLNRAIVERVELNAYEQADLEAAQSTYRVLAGYRRRLDLTSLKAEILHKYDKRGKKSVLARWHKPGGLTVDAVAADINEQLRAEGSTLQLTEDAHPSEILSQIIDGFDKAVYTVKEQFATENALQFESEAERNAFRDLVKKRLFEGVRNGGRESAHARFVKNHDRVVLELSKRMRAKAKDLEAATRKQNVYATAILRARELAEMVKQHKYVGAEHLIAPEMKAVGDLLSRTANLRGIKDPAVRKAMRQLAAWYTPQSICPDQVDEKGNVEDGAMFRADIRDAIAALADGEGLLSVSEVKILADILSHIRKIYTEYDRVVIGGKAESLARIAQDQVKLENTYAEWDEKRRRKLVAAWQKVRNGYLFQAMTPRQVIQTLEFFDEKGVLHRLYEDIQAGLARTNSDYADMMTPLVNFLEEHKGYGKRLSKGRIEYQGDTLTVGQAIALYLTTYREQAKLGLEETGISYMGKDGHVHKLGGRAVKDIRRDIEGQLNDTDREYIKIVKALFKRAGEMKVKADTEIFGYTNVEDGFYFPILRDAMGRASKTSDFRQAMRDIAVVANKSFNKDTKQGAKGRLMIGDVTEIANAHVRGVAQYANLFTPLQAFDRVWNKPIDGEDGRTTVREIVNDRIWTAKGERGAADKYLQKLFSDIQEVGVIREVGDDVYSKLRTAYVSAALGLNLSSCLKQFGSYGTALLYLGAGDLAKGAVMKADVAKMRKYSVVANGRLFDRSTVVGAETNVAAGRAGEGLARIQELATAPVEKTDDFVISRLWNACQLAVQRQQGHALGTEENLTAAGKVLDKVINESQSTNTADTRSGMQRGGKIMQTLTMFTSDAVKSVSYLYEAAMRGYMARQRVKMGIGSDAEVKAAKQFGKRAFAAYLTSMAITVAVIQFIKWLLKKERDEDETLAQDVGGEIAGHMIGMLPLVSDVYSLAKDGYEIESFALDTVNTLVTTAKSVSEMASDAAGGAYVDEKKLATTLKNGVVAVSNLFGIPIRNVHNYTTGLMKRFFGSSTYGYTSLFSAGAYEADLQAAVQAGDEALALRVVQVMAKRQRGGELDSAAAAEILYLYGDGHDVLGGGIPQTYNGTPVNAEQHRAMEAICGKADDAVEALVAGEIYQGLTDEEKARAIYRTYSTYLALAKRDVLGAKGNTATEVMDLIPADVLMAALGRIDLLKGDESSTRAEKVAAYLNTLHLTQEQKYLILYAAGYDNKTVSAAVEKLKKGKRVRGDS